MHDAFTYVIWIVCGIGVVIGVLTFATNAKVWEEIGRRGLVSERDLSRPATGTAMAISAADTAERDSEIRQMLCARNERRLRRGEAPLDVEAELVRLTGGGQVPSIGSADGRGESEGSSATLGGVRIDEELRVEIRQLVQARNHRRMRRGEPALDVEAEVQRQIASMSDSVR